jgi:hypothetical protein
MMLGRSFASSLFSSGSNGKLTINLSSVAVEIEPVKNLTFQSGLSYRTLERFPTFSLDYYTDAGQTVTKNSESVRSQFVSYTPNRKRLGML